ncbi:hypothetical protein LTR53_007017 [Teratosphaeriaceae sp. CCFEE 6253]|nr:hypothetical protein LTR53_007017 [Teratosphaeriaceae sp. CCFEE 6253]
MPTNTAAWILEKCGPVVVGAAPMPEPREHEIVIRAHALALNPVDGFMHARGLLTTSWPTVLGCDVAGTVLTIGRSVTRFQPGDRVTACVDQPPDERRANKGAFQLYCAADEALSAKLPESVSFAEGCVLPLAMCTAAASLFQKSNLGLPLPKLDTKPSGKVLVVWGGSSSVGSCAVQLARAAGCAVATTCGAENADYCRALGVEYVFDHASASVVEDIVRALQGTESVGVFDAIMAAGTLVQCAEIAQRLGGRKHLATVLVGPPTAQVVPEGLPGDVGVSYCWGTTIRHDEVGAAVFGEWMTPALASGALKCKPDTEIVGEGLEAVQEACERMSRGVSAKKLVVVLP